MKQTYITISTVVFLVLISTAGITSNNGKTLKAHHKELTCFDCHQKDYPTQSLGVSCATCHGTAEEVAKQTTSKYKQHYNPHDPLHYGTQALCENCHREHAPSRLECNNPNCHGEFIYITP